MDENTQAAATGEQPGNSQQATQQQAVQSSAASTTPAKKDADPTKTIALKYKKGSRLPNLPARDIMAAEVPEYFRYQDELDGAVASGAYSATDDAPKLPKRPATAPRTSKRGG